ncbi:MAG: hypothetical protein PVG51_08800 [Desulfosarcina sp.]
MDGLDALFNSTPVIVVGAFSRPGKIGYDILGQHIKELDINPLLVHPEGEGTAVADCRFFLEKR